MDPTCADLFARHPQPMWMYDAATLALLEVNDAAVAQYGYARDEFLALSAADVIADGVAPTATVHRLKSGECIDVDVTARELTRDGRSIIWITAVDVTARKRADTAMAERIAVTGLLADVAVALNRPQSVRKTLQRCAEAVVAHLDAAVVRIWTMTEDGGALALEATACLNATPYVTPTLRPVVGTTVGRIATAQLPLFTNAARGHQAIEFQDWLDHEQIVAFAGCPLIVEGLTIGVLTMYARHTLSEPVTSGLVSTTAQIALGLARRKAEIARQLLAAFDANSEDAIVGAELDGTINSWNASAERFFGYTAAEALGRSVADLIFPEMYRGDLPASLRRVANGEVLQTETVRRHKLGALIPVWLTLSASRSVTGEIVGVSALYRDISDRRRVAQTLHQTEERMRFALEASGIGVWEVNLRTGDTYWSNTCEQLHGLPVGAFAKTFEAFVACVYPEDQLAFRDAIAGPGRGSGNVEVEYRTIWSDQSVHRINTVAHFACDETGMPIGVAGIAVDVTERRRLEEQLRQSQKMEAIGQLAGGVAHDFNNLLTAIQGYAGMLVGSVATADRESVHMIQRAAERAADLTRQLLAFSRKQILEVRVVRVGDVVNDLTPMLKRLLGETIDLRTHIADHGTVKADPGQLHQVLMNLAVNARDAMPYGGSLVIESADIDIDHAFARRHPSMSAGPHVMIAVTDTGFGMDAATQKRIFEPFFTTKPKDRGTGLGLSTVYGIVKQSGGSIWVHSEPQRGARFEVYLPRTTEAADSGLVAPEAPRPLSRGVERVLLVEDEELVREYVWEVLRRQGYNVHGVGHPADAIAFVAENQDPIDLILTDVVLPDMSGPAMISRLLEHRAGSRVLYMSGYADEAVVQHGVFEAGTWFLQKPFDSDTLTRKVREVLDARAPREAHAGNADIRCGATS